MIKKLNEMGLHTMRYGRCEMLAIIILGAFQNYKNKQLHDNNI